MSENVNQEYKLLLVGDAAVGKSSLLKRYTSDAFQSNPGSTIGVDFMIKFYRVNGERIKLMLWDTAGIERYRMLAQRYYDEAHGVMLVYDVTRRSSLESLEKIRIRDAVEHNSVKSAVKMIVANKADKVDGGGVDEAFKELIEKIRQTPELLEDGIRRAGKSMAPSKQRPRARQCCSTYGVVFDRFLDLICARSK